MQVDSNYGVIPDSLTTIQQTLLSSIQNIFTNATDPSSYVYINSYLMAQQFSVIQNALAILANAKNVFTVTGIAQDQLYLTLFNLLRLQQTQSYAIITVVVSAAVTIPNGTLVQNNITPTVDTYTVTQDWDLPSAGAFTIIAYSNDITDVVPSGYFNQLSGNITEVLSVANLDDAILGTPIETDSEFRLRAQYFINILGQTYYGLEKVVNNLNIPALDYVEILERIDDPNRGFNLYISYPPNAIVSGNGVFNPNDFYINLIANSVFQYMAEGTQSYADVTNPSNATTVVCAQPLSGYTKDILINPITLDTIGVSLNILYTDNPLYSGFNGGTFPSNLIPGNVLTNQLIVLINNYFLSKRIPSDTLYTVQQLRDIIDAAYPGIVDMPSFYFFEILTPTTQLSSLTRAAGHVYNLQFANFNITYTENLT